MKIALFVAALALQNRAVVSTPPEKVAEAYAQFLLAHHLDERDDEAGAIAAYKKAMELDPAAADIPAELAALYLRQNNMSEARATAELALKVAPANREANRVLGIVYAAMIDGGGRGDASRRRAAPASPQSNENIAKAIHHLEVAIDGAARESDPNVRATLARLYLRSDQYAKAIPLLNDLVRQEPGWQDGPMLLIDAYEHEHRWNDAANAYEDLVEQSPRSVELKMRYASALLKAGGRENLTKARDLLNGVLATKPTDAQTLYLMSQTQRQLGDAKSAEETARRLIEQNDKTPWGYYALAEALEERRQYQAVIDALAPIVAAKSPGFDTSVLLPHLGFAYQEMGEHDKAIATFEDARRRSPNDPNLASYVVEANIAAKKYGSAIEAAQAALNEHPDDLRLIRLQAQALRRSGKADQGIALLEGALKKHGDDPTAYVALAQIYADTERTPQAVRVLQEGQTKFPADVSLMFELGSVYDKQKRFTDAEAQFQRILARDPENAATLNYLGYMLAERGERLDESVNYLKKALQIEPENGSYLDSLGWAYFKADKLDLAEDNLRKAADQLKTNSVIQEHYGEVLFKLGRYNDAIAAWMRALNGDGSDIDRADIDKKIREAKQKLNRK
jgi:tetratricopeptide (TPR) repeat protein